MSKMVIAQADDWQGIYIDGDLKTEGHSTEGIVLVGFAIDYGVQKVETAWVDLKWIHELGNMPQKLEDVQWEKPSA